MWCRRVLAQSNEDVLCWSSDSLLRQLELHCLFQRGWHCWKHSWHSRRSRCAPVGSLKCSSANNMEDSGRFHNHGWQRCSSAHNFSQTELFHQMSRSLCPTFIRNCPRKRIDHGSGARRKEKSTRTVIDVGQCRWKKDRADRRSKIDSEIRRSSRIEATWVATTGERSKF